MLGEKLEGEMIYDNVKSLKKCPNCDNTNLQDFPNIVNTKFIEGVRKTFYTWSCYSCRKEIISYQTD